MTQPSHSISSAMALLTPQTTPQKAMGLSVMQARTKEVSMHDPVAGDLATKDAWKQFSKTTPFLGVPPEIHLKLFGLLNPIDAVCLSLVKYVLPHPDPRFALSLTHPSKYMYTISPKITPDSHPLDIGEPGSEFPVEKREGCKHCVPVRFYPHHCELHFHLRGFIPKEFNFCGGQCRKYTLCEQKGYSDSHEYCGTCGVSYWRRYQRGRRMLDVLRPGEKQERLCKWYNNPKQ
jgi:hypothetical protein